MEGLQRASWALAVALSYALSPWKHFSRCGTYWRPNKDFPIALHKRQNISCSEYSIFLWLWICKNWQARVKRSLFFPPWKTGSNWGRKGVGSFLKKYIYLQQVGRSRSQIQSHGSSFRETKRSPQISHS